MRDFAPGFPRRRAALRELACLAAGTILALAMILAVECCLLYAMTQPQLPATPQPRAAAPGHLPPPPSPEAQMARNGAEQVARLLSCNILDPAHAALEWVLIGTSYSHAPRRNPAMSPASRPQSARRLITIRVSEMPPGPGGRDPHPPALTAMNLCPIPGCREYTYYLLCAAHWELVPLELQHTVNKTWRLLNDRQRKDHADCEKNYRAARDAALAHVREVVGEGDAVSATHRA